MTDESFFSFRQMLENLLSFQGEFTDEENGVHSYIYEIEIGTPVELDISVDENGKVTIGSVPPVYRVNTSFRPSYHSITIKAEKYIPDNGE
ncbi:hypothetical protein [Chitinophaga solisilvae]|uniref:Uncharacterized protein n=1 Tax=Chitinophaga solisilvae TaxID=1233460 RepID=A0A433WKZ2_9BACT|nr:hypothetical protein [Chitinophaga solisilvae]NSL90807.1 hypothetical protein [Chitinophaga solisilvae]